MPQKIGDTLMRNDPYSQYSTNSSQPQMAADPYSQYEHKEEIPQEPGKSYIQSSSPFLYKMAQQLSQHPYLNKAAKIAADYVAQPIVEGTEMLGLPVIAEHALAAPRKFAQLMTGQNPHASTERLNPYVAQGAKGFGQAISLLSGGALTRAGMQARGLSSSQKLQKALNDMVNSEQQLKQQQAEATHKFGTSSPERLSLKAEDMAQNAQNMTKAAQELSQGFGGPMQPSHLIEQGARGAAESAENAIKQFGGEGQNFPLRIQQEFMKELRGEKNPETGRRQHGFMQAVGNQYQTLGNRMKKDNITIEKTPQISEVASWIEKNMPDLPQSAKDKAAAEWVKQSTTQSKIGADKFLTGYRGLKHELFKARQRSTAYGENPKTADEWKEKANDIQTQLNKMSKAMDDQLGGHYLAELKRIDKQYSTQIAPLQENPLYRAMVSGKITGNPLQEITQDIPGNETLRMIVGKNPELQRLLFGQQYASSPKKLVGPNEVAEGLGALNPKVKGLIEGQRTAQANLEPRLAQAKQMAEFEKLSKEIPETQMKSQEAAKKSKEIEELMKDKTLSKEKYDALAKKKSRFDKIVGETARTAGLHSFLKWLYTSPLS